MFRCRSFRLFPRQYNIYDEHKAVQILPKKTKTKQERTKEQPNSFHILYVSCLFQNRMKFILTHFGDTKFFKAIISQNICGVYQFFVKPLLVERCEALLLDLGRNYEKPVFNRTNKICMITTDKFLKH